MGALEHLLKTIAKPVYNWVIGTDNDDVMKRFTTRMLPETQFRAILKSIELLVMQKKVMEPLYG